MTNKTTKATSTNLLFVVIPEGNLLLERRLVEKPEDWQSSFRHYLTGVSATVEIESHWTA